MNDSGRTTATTAVATSWPPYHGWWVVAAAFIVAVFGWGIGFYGLGIYLVALQQRHGWPIGEVATAITLYYLAGAVQVFFLGRLFDRFGPRRVVLTGAIAMVLGILLLTAIVRPWQIYAAFAVMSLGWAAMSNAAINILVAPWFDRRRGLAVSLALTGASVGGLALAPLLVFLIDRLGLTVGLWAAAGLMLAVLFPVAGVALRPRRRDECEPVAGQPPPDLVNQGDPPWRLGTVLRSRRFHTISIPFALGLTAQVGFLTHQVAFLSPMLGTIAAGWVVSLTTLAAIAGRIATGFIVDHVDRRAVAGANLSLQCVALIVLLLAESPTMLVLGCVLYGLGVGNLISLPGLIVQHEFPARHFARIVSLIVAINQFTFAFGPGLLGYLRQAADDYTTALLACLSMQALAAIIVVTPTLRRWWRPGSPLHGPR